MALIEYKDNEGGTDEPVLAYLLFAFEGFDRLGGVADLVASADTVEELQEYFICLRLVLFQIVEAKTMKIIKSNS